MDGTVYMITAPKDATYADVSRMAVEIYLNEDHPPENIKAEAVGEAPNGESVWAITVPDGPGTPQEASGGDEPIHPGEDVMYGGGGP